MISFGSIILNLNIRSTIFLIGNNDINIQLKIVDFTLQYVYNTLMINAKLIYLNFVDLQKQRKHQMDK